MSSPAPSSLSEGNRPTSTAPARPAAVSATTSGACAPDRLATVQPIPPNATTSATAAAAITGGDWPTIPRMSPSVTSRCDGGYIGDGAYPPLPGIRRR
jgi:hypothetical protein